MIGTIAKDLLRPIYHSIEQLVEGDLIGKNAVLKDRYLGETCYLFGTGSVINKIDLGRFRQVHTYACNFFFRHPDFSALHPRFYASVPTLRTMKQKEHDIQPQHFFKEFARRASFPMDLFLHTSCKGFIERRGYFNDQNIHFVRSSGPMRLATELSFDLTKPVPFLDGVVFFMLASCFYMGFKKIYLCGFGYTFKPFLSGHFYENWEQTSDGDVDPRHFVMRDLALAHGIEVLNVVPNGFASPIYNGVCLDECYASLPPSDLQGAAPY